MIKSKEALARPGASLSKEVHMAKNDYHVIVYYILSYLYHCLKMGETPQIETLSLLDYPAEIPESYGNFIYMELSRQGFISGAVWGQVPVAGKGRVKALKSLAGVQITAEGIDYLENNSTMTRTWEKLKEGGGLLLQIIGAFR